MNRARRTVITAVILNLPMSVGVSAQTFQINSYTVDGGGTTSAGGTFALHGTVGQSDAAVASLSGGTFQLTSGFWPGDATFIPAPPSVPPCDPPAVWLGIDDVVVSSRVGGGGQIWVLEGDRLCQLGTTTGFDAGATTVDIQSDGQIIVGSDTGGGSGTVTRVDPLTLLPTAVAAALGAPVEVVSVDSFDYVYFGMMADVDTSNSQLRVPDLSRIATIPDDGLNGGPAQFGHPPSPPDPGSGIFDTASQSDDDRIILYEDNRQPASAQGRIRRMINGDFVLSGGDEGLGAVGATPILGVAVALQSDDTIVLAKTDRKVELRNPNTLSPDLGGFTRSAGPFGADITALAVLGDNRVVIGTVGGEIQVRSSNLQTSLASQGGFGEITAITVQSDNDILVGNSAGTLWRLDSSMSSQAFQEGFGTITDIAVFAQPPASACHTPPQDFDGDGDVDLDDWYRFSLCFGGPGQAFGAAGTACWCFDADVDLDVDLGDAAAILKCLGGGPCP